MITDNFQETVIPVAELKDNLNKFINSSRQLELQELTQGTKVFADFAIIPGENPPPYLNAETIFYANKEQNLDVQKIRQKQGHKIIFVQYFDPETENLLHFDFLTSYIKMHFPEAAILADISYVVGKQPIYMENWGIQSFYIFYDKLYNIIPTGQENPDCEAFVDYFSERQQKVMELGIKTDEDSITFAPMWKIIIDNEQKYIK